MKNTSIKRWLVAMAMASFAAVAHAWQPTGAVEIIVAAGPGGGNDKTARLLAKLLHDRKLVSTPIVIMNKPGAGGVIAQNYLNSHAGDGHYLMVTNPALITNPLTGIGSVNYREVTPVAQLFTEYVILLAKKGSSRAPDIQAVLASWKKTPNELTLGVAPAVAAGTHIGIAKAAMAAGIDPAELRIVPYATSGEVMNALVGGHIDLMASTPINVLPQLENGQIKPLAITAPHRLTGALADTPTFQELGIDAQFGNWRGLVGPTNMSAEQVAYWDQVFAGLSGMAEWDTEIAQQQSEETYMPSQDSKRFLDEENTQLTTTLKQLGFSRDK